MYLCTCLFRHLVFHFISEYIIIVCSWKISADKSLFAFVRAQIIWSKKRSEVKTFAKKIRWRGAAEITRYSGYTCDPRTPQRSFFCGVMQVGEGAQSSTSNSNTIWCPELIGLNQAFFSEKYFLAKASSRERWLLAKSSSSCKSCFASYDGGGWVDMPWPVSNLGRSMYE